MSKDDKPDHEHSPEWWDRKIEHAFAKAFPPEDD